jgi:hypothetical protein
MLSACLEIIEKNKLNLNFTEELNTLNAEIKNILSQHNKIIKNNSLQQRLKQYISTCDYNVDKQNELNEIINKISFYSENKNCALGYIYDSSIIFQIKIDNKIIHIRFDHTGADSNESWELLIDGECIVGITGRYNDKGKIGDGYIQLKKLFKKLKCVYITKKEFLLLLINISEYDSLVRLFSEIVQHHN